MHFKNCCDFIDQNITSGNVLVHCQAGVSRSATIVIAYIMKKNKIKSKAALEFVQEKRPIVGPNDGFLEQLKSWELDLKL